MPEHKCYVEPFAGGLWVLLNKNKSSVEVINDINEDLINFYRIVRNNYEDFKKALKYLVPSRQMFEEYVNMGSEDLNKMSNIERAVRFLYINRCSHSGRMQNFGYSNSRRSNLCCLTDDIDLIIDQIHGRIKDAYIECWDYKKIIERYDERLNSKEKQNVLFYFDPPYHETYDYEGNGIDLTEFSQKLNAMNSKWILTINKTSLTEEIFEKYNITRVSISETIANLGKNSKIREELIITNYTF